MTEHDAYEQAYRNGYEAGKAAGAPKWITVEERLPEHCVNVLSYNGVCVQMDFYDEGFECWCSEIEQVPIRVTHWMPVPLEPPKEV